MTWMLLGGGILSVLASIGASAGDGEAKVFILAGQSNMVGRGSPAELPPELRQVPKNVTMYRGNTEMKDAFTGDRFGPEVGFAHELAKAMPNDKIIIVKHAVVGTSVFEWLGRKAPVKEGDADEAAARDPNTLYPKLRRRIATATKGRQFQYCAMVWEQGGRDAIFPEAAADYAKNLKLFIERVRSDTASPALPFLYGEVGALPAARFPATETVRACQQQVAKEVPNVKLVDTKGLTTIQDKIHFDTSGQIELGRRFAKAYLDLVTPAEKKDK